MTCFRPDQKDPSGLSPPHFVADRDQIVMFFEFDDLSLHRFDFTVFDPIVRSLAKDSVLIG